MVDQAAVNAAFIGAGFLAGTLATGLVLALRDALAVVHTLPIALWVLATTLLAATLIHNDRFKFDYPPTWVWTFVYAAVPFAVPFLVLRQRRTADAEPQPMPRLRPLRVISAVFGVAHPGRRDRALRRPRRASAGTGCGRSRRCSARAVAAWYALFGTMLISCAIGMRRPADAIIPLRDARLLERAAAAPARASTPEQVSGGGLWYALMAALLALSAYALTVGLRQKSDR